MKKNNKIKKCQWCSRFVGNKGRATLKNPDIYYCDACYKKGEDEEKEAIYGDCLYSCKC